ncbi:hypothetical protein AB0K48_51305 [Nonomuraea sp. NPDC055795]
MAIVIAGQGYTRWISAVATGTPATAAGKHHQADAELAAVRAEAERRADLPPDRRATEHAARVEHAERQATADDGHAQPGPGPRTPYRGHDREQAYRPPDRTPGQGRDLSR